MKNEHTIPGTNSGIPSSVADLARRVRKFESENRAAGSHEAAALLAHIAAQLETGDFGPHAGRSYDTLCIDERTANRTLLWAGQIVREIGINDELQTADDMLASIVFGACLGEVAA